MMKFIITPIKQVLIRVNSLPRVLLLIIGILFSYSLVRSVIRYNNVNNRLSEARENLDGLSEQNKELQKEVESVKTVDFIEKEARDKLGLAYENEYVLVLPDETTLRRLSPRMQKLDNTKLPDPNWKKWWNLFF